MKFKAKILVQVRLRRKIRKSDFLLLTNENREYTEFYGIRDYFEILPPSLNIKIREIKKKLAKYKMKYTETYEGGFLIIESD